MKSECTDCPDFATCSRDSSGHCATQCFKFLWGVLDDDGTESCVTSSDPTETGAGEGVMLNSKIDNNMELILDNLFGAMVQKNNRRERVVTENSYQPSIKIIVSSGAIKNASNGIVHLVYVTHPIIE